MVLKLEEYLTLSIFEIFDLE